MSFPLTNNIIIIKHQKSSIKPQAEASIDFFGSFALF